MTPDDPQEEAVRRLLASEATPEPLPPEVGARLDDVLAGLVAERSHPVVTPLRRRRWPQVLVAAAGITLFGYVGATLVQGQAGSDDATTAGAADESTAELELERPAEEFDSGAETAPEAAPAIPQDGGADVRDQLLSRTLAERRDALEELGASADDDAAKSRAQRNLSSLQRCDGPGREGLETVSLGGDLYALVDARPVGRTSSVVTIYPCGQPRFPLASYVALGFR